MTYPPDLPSLSIIARTHALSNAFHSTVHELLLHLYKEVADGHPIPTILYDAFLEALDCFVDELYAMERRIFDYYQTGEEARRLGREPHEPKL